jgi:hypothetical protein
MWRVGPLRAELKVLFSSEVVPLPELSMWSPVHPADFAIRVQVFIGPEGSDTSDSFDTIVCTPKWLAHNWDDPRIGGFGLSPQVKSGRGLLLMKRWDYADLHQAIEGLCGSVAGMTWGDVADRIGRQLPWEFDYVFDREQDDRRTRP